MEKLVPFLQLIRTSRERESKKTEFFILPGIVIFFIKSKASSSEGIAVNLRVVLQMQRLQKVSPPFEGGVAGTIDYLMFTKFISRPGWLI
jgi:hypothetical protein